MYLSKTPDLVKPLSKDLYWRVKTDEKVLYITFDDGPTPGVTPGVLSLLASYNAKATFFCVGKNVRKHPEVFSELTEQGHVVGNHSYDHNNGWKTSGYNYLKSYLKCAELVDSGLYRPPYGKITLGQSKAISTRSKIVMWDVLSGDFDKKSSPETCAKRVIKHSEPGSIVVFHDSIKAAPRMQPALEAALQHFSDEGFRFETLVPELL